VESIDGKLVLRIPLAAGGSGLVSCSRGIGIVNGDFLDITIPGWLAEKLRICEGNLVAVDHKNGKFNIQRCGDEPTRPPAP